MATVLGSRLILNVDADPNTIPGLEIQSELESQFAIDLSTGKVYKYDPTLDEGERWVICDTRPYKVYTALLAQSGTDAPVATVLENTLGTVTWERAVVGAYVGYITTDYSTESKMVIFSASYATSQTSSSVFVSVVNNTVDGNAEIIITDGVQGKDSVLYDFPIEIRVYP